MGFFKFLKKDKKVDVTELDLPPEPPPLEGFEDANLPEFPDIEAPKDTDLKFDFPEMGTKTDEWAEVPKDLPDKMPDLPKFPEAEQQATAPVQQPSDPIIAAAQPIELPKPEDQQSMPAYHRPRRIFHRERDEYSEKPVRKELYVRVDKFRNTLDNINAIKDDLRKSEDILIKFESLKNSRDSMFDRAKSALDDLQRKLIFMDKTLFKGE